ncbi:MAG: 6-phosphofructokinase [Collinsella sp.]
MIEIMGHKVGWIPLYSAVAGGADVCLIPEIPYEMDNVIAAIDRRMQSGARFTIIVVAEGAISREEAALSKKEYKKLVAARTSPSIAYDIAREVEARCGRETRVSGARPAHPARRSARCAGPRVRHTVWCRGGAGLLGGGVRLYGGPARRRDAPRAAGRGRRQAQVRRPCQRPGA